MARKQAFKHDFGARNDVRLVNVRLHHGMAGIGVYWCIIEMMYESETGRIETGQIPNIAFEFGVDAGMVASIVNDFGLFQCDETTFWSPSAIERIEHGRNVSAKRQIAGRLGGAPKGNTNANRTNPDDEQPQEQQEIAPVIIPAVPVEPEIPPQVEPKKPKVKRFIKPTIDEVAAEIVAKGYHFDAETFVAFYESKGWMIGKNPMKSWKSAMVTWEKRHKQEQAAKPATAKQNNNINDIWT